jgi:hypothetical protein
MNNIQKLYNSIYDIARKVQITQVNGKEIWGKIESMIQPIVMEQHILYNNTLKNIYENMDNIKDYEKIKNNEYNPISNHFFLQLRNLVETKSKFVIFLYRVGQIAYNAGQLSIFIENDNINKDIKDFVIKNNMLDINTYITEDIQNEISMILNQHNIDKIIYNINNLINQNGGNLSSNHNNIYLQKYLKYKEKYINLKNNVKN